MFLQYVGVKKLVSSFGLKFFSHIHPISNRLHSSYWQILATSRLSSSSPNLQQIPSDKEFRSCFKCEKGNSLLVVDFSNQELRIAANYANEENMLNEFNHGVGDVHSLTARAIYNIKGEVPNDKRQVGKNTNFTILFGGGGSKVAERAKISKKEGNEAVKGFYRLYPAFKALFTKWHKLVKKNGYIVLNPLTKARTYIVDKDYKEYKRLDTFVTKMRNFYPSYEIPFNILDR